MAALLALCGGLLWGVGDFLGGLASRRLAVLAVVVVSQAIGLTGLLVVVLLTGESFPGVGALLPAVGAGVAVLLGITAFYRGLAIGAMGIVAPISAAGPVVPLAFDAAHGSIPTALQWLGIALILVGIATLSWERSSSGSARLATGTGLAVIAALGFGFYFVGIDAGADESASWAVIAARATVVTLGVLAALATSTSLRPPRALLPMLVAIGFIDMFGNVLVAEATTHGAAGIVAVLSSLYPLVTILLARLVVGEHLSAAKRTGGFVALGGATLVAAG
ncbi:MAG TPA: DMT family transporter [Gaiellaceae bacterium]|nr:DMT family transporter [Gaiellaceae bacterium]